MSAFLALVAGVLGNVSAANLGFTDDASIPSWAAPAIEGLMDLGVMTGNDDGSFSPNRQLNRAEVAKIITLATGVPMDTTGGPHFPDVQTGAWYYDYVETMYNNGDINGYPDGQFRPEVGINRAEIAKMVVNAFDCLETDLSGAPHFTDVNSSDWFYSYVETAYNYNLMDGFGDGSFGPELPVTRAETAVIVWNAYLQCASGIDNGSESGTLELMLSGDTPAGTSIAFNAVSVPYTTIDFTASADADAEIASLTFTRLGLGDPESFDKCWFEVDGFKISSESTVNADDMVTVRFNPAMVVPAGTTVTGDLVCSMKTGAINTQGAPDNAGQRNRFALISVEDVDSSSAQVVGNFPIEGEEMVIAEYEVSTMEHSCLGTNSTITVGTSFTELYKFKLTNDSATNKDILLRAMTFKNKGSAELEDVIANPALYVSGQQVSVETIVDGDYVSFLLDDGTTGGLVVEDGDSVIFSLRGDLISAEQGDTIEFEIDNAEDIVGIEVGTSFGVRVVDSTGDLAEDNATSCSTYTLDAGDLTLSRDPSSLGNQEYAPGSDDVIGATCRVVAQQPVATDGIKFCLTTGSVVGDENGNGTANELADFNKAFSNYRLYLDDTLVDTANTLTAPTNSTTVADFCVDFSTTFEIAGTSVMKLAMDIEDAANTGSKIKFQAVATDFDSPEYISTGDQLTSSETVGTCAASFVEVEESEICLAKSDSNSDGDKFVAGADGLNVLSFTGTLNDSGDAVVTSITVMANASGAACSMSNITGAFFVNGTQVGSAQTFNSVTGNSCQGTVTFSDLSVVVPSGEQVEFDFIIDTSEVLAMCSASSQGYASVADNMTCTLTEPLYGQDNTAKVSCSTTVVAGDKLVFTPQNATVNSGSEVAQVLVKGDGINSINQLIAAAFTDEPAATATNNDWFGHLFSELTTDLLTNGIVSTDPVVACNPVTEYQIGDPLAIGGTSTRQLCGDLILPAGELLLINSNASAFTYSAIMTAQNTQDPIVQTISTTGSMVSRLNATFTVPAGATSACFPVDNTANFASGDTVEIKDTNVTPNPTLATGTVSSVVSSPKQVCVNFATGTSTPFVYNVGDVVKEINTGDRIRFFVSQFEAENVENGSTVKTCEGTPELALGAADTSLDASCGLKTMTSGGYTSVAGTVNYLCGADLLVTCGGRLTVNKNTDIVGDILTSGDTDKPVLEVRLAATDDQVEVTDLCFINDLDLNDRTNSITKATYPFTNTGYTASAPATGTAIYNAAGAAAAACVNTDRFGNTGVGPSTTGVFEGVMQLPSTVVSGYQPEQSCSAAITAIGAALTTTQVYETEVEDVLQFSLYNAAGQKIDGPRNMTNGKICFQMSNSSRIVVPKDGQTTVTVKATVGNVGSIARTGHALRLRLDESALDNSGNPTYGVEAISSSTGADLDPLVNNGGNSFLSGNLPTTTTAYGLNGDGYGSVYGDVFVVYNTEPTIKHATTQPQIAISSGATSLMPVYYFTVTPDSSDPVSLQRVTFDINLNGMAVVCPFAEGDHYDADFTVATTAPVPAFAPAPAAPCTPVNAPIMTVEDLNASSTGTFSTGTVRVLTVDNNAIKGDAASSTHATIQVNFKGQYLSAPKTYVLYLANTYDTNPLNTDEQVSVTILKDKVYSSPASLAYQLFRGGDALVTSADVQANVVWSDDAANLISIETSPQLADFMNGYLINQDITPQVNDRF